MIRLFRVPGISCLIVGNSANEWGYTKLTLKNKSTEGLELGLVQDHMVMHVVMAGTTWYIAGLFNNCGSKKHSNSKEHSSVFLLPLQLSFPKRRTSSSMHLSQPKGKRPPMFSRWIWTRI